MTPWEVAALIAFILSAILAVLSPKVDAKYGPAWAVLMAVGLGLWLVSTTSWAQ